MVFSFILTGCSTVEYDLPFSKAVEHSYCGVMCEIIGKSDICTLAPRQYIIKTSVKNLEIEWRVLSGDITLLSGQVTSSASFSFGDSFKTGRIYCMVKEKGGGRACAEIETIVYDSNCNELW